MVQINHCDDQVGWSVSGGVMSNDAADKQEGTNSLVGTAGVGQWNIYLTYDPAGTWDWSLTTNCILWIKPESLKDTRLEIFTDWANYRYCTSIAGLTPGAWTESTVDVTTGTDTGSPDLSSIDFLRLKYQAENGLFYIKYDDIRAESPEEEAAAAVKKKVMGHRVKLPIRVRDRHFRHQYY